MAAREVYLDTYGEHGFTVSFPYDPQMVARIKREVLGLLFDPKRKVWYSTGPEVLLDLQRWGYSAYPTQAAWERAGQFMAQVERILDLREQTVDAEYGYQQIGTDVLLAQKRGILGDDMGLGKTKQTIDAISRLWPCKVLVLAPKSLIYNWEPEFAKWSAIPTAILPDGKKQREAFWAEKPYTRAAVIANWDGKLIADDWPMDIRWDVVVVDEATGFKNWKSQRTKAIGKIVDRAEHVWFLTGTPLEIRVEELYQLMRLVRPSVFGGFPRFRDVHLVTDMMGNVRGLKGNTKELLTERIAPFLLRRTKQDVQLQIPPKLYNEVWVDLPGEDQRTYNQMVSQFEAWLKEQGRDATEANKLTQLLRLQQFTSSPDLVKPEEDPVPRPGAKFAALQDLIDGWDGQVMVFTRFSEMAERLVQWLELPPDALIAGAVGAQERVDRITRFNLGNLGKVLVSTDAGAYGLNVTSADLIVHYDMLWNPGKMAQREDRLHRIGQTKTVNVVRMLTADTVDAGMHHVTLERAQLFRELMDGAEEAILRAIDLRKVAKGEAQPARRAVAS